MDEAIWVAEKALRKAESEWKEACKLMKELKLKPKLLSLIAWLWASATVRTLPFESFYRKLMHNLMYTCVTN